ncbi:hypothetical protein DS2_13569 [Catenovulum agarivorans DS-2]|uniref:DUF58 domain-containing protein n=2 Tax=Catenovulum agarivorans TaxID=1172192 RepID=W7QMQ2_9ALTE|nr:hypothetical protein DS2_13569 [Catenovulum agarivorans DS-2]
MPELLHYRSKTGLLDLSPKYGLQARLSGQYVSAHKGRGMEFDEVRHYQPGDDIRMIDWRVTARTNTTHTKLFREERERPVFIVTDLSESMQFGSQLLFKSVQASHLASLMAWAVNRMGDRLGGIVFNEQQHAEQKPKARTPSVLHYLHHLEQMNTQVNNNTDNSSDDTNQHFIQTCMRLRRLARPGSLIIIISDFHNLNETATKHLTLLSQHCEIMAYRIFDPMEQALPKFSGRMTLPVEYNGEQGVVTLGDHKIAQSYQSEYQHMIAQQDAWLRRCRCIATNVSAGVPLEVQLR